MTKCAELQSIYFHVVHCSMNTHPFPTKQKQHPLIIIVCRLQLSFMVFISMLSVQYGFNSLVNSHQSHSIQLHGYSSVSCQIVTAHSLLYCLLISIIVHGLHIDAQCLELTPISPCKLPTSPLLYSPMNTHMFLPNCNATCSPLLSVSFNYRL